MDENTPRNSNEEIDTSEIKSRIGVNKVILKIPNKIYLMMK